MQTTKISILIFIIFFCFCACKSDTSKKVTDPVIVTKKEDRFYSIPQDIIMEIWNEADILDYIFHDLPFSMSQDQQASIRTNVTYIGQIAQPDIPAGCKPMARQVYGKKGEIFLEADIYFDANCQFYVFIVNGKPKYANKMSEEGVNFFKAMISQALKSGGAG